MNTILDRVPGPYFDFLVLSPGECWDRPGRRSKIRTDFFHHPDALRLQEPIVSAFYDCFQRAHAGFNYYGPTEFYGGNLTALISALSSWQEQLEAAQGAGKLLQSVLTS